MVAKLPLPTNGKVGKVGKAFPTFAPIGYKYPS